MIDMLPCFDGKTRVGGDMHTRTSDRLIDIPGPASWRLQSRARASRVDIVRGETSVH